MDDSYSDLFPLSGADLERQLRFLIRTMREGIGGEIVAGDYWINTVVPHTDFSIEIIPPDMNPVYPTGALGISVGEGAWACAALPLEFRALPLEALVYIIWPEHAGAIDPR